MTTLSIINELKTKETFTALDNQVAKLSRVEMELYAKCVNKGMEGEAALDFVLNASLMGII